MGNGSVDGYLTLYRLFEFRVYVDILETRVREMEYFEEEKGVPRDRSHSFWTGRLYTWFKSTVPVSVKFVIIIIYRKNRRYFYCILVLYYKRRSWVTENRRDYPCISGTRDLHYLVCIVVTMTGSWSYIPEG